MNPPEKNTKLVADPVRSKMVSIKALRDVRLANDTILKEGATATVTEEEANEFCDRPVVPAHYAFSGERPNNEVARHSHKRAVRL